MDEKNPIVLCAEGFVLASMFFLLTFMIAPPMVEWHQEAHRISVSLDTDRDGIANTYDVTPYGAMRAQFGTMGKPPMPIMQADKCSDKRDNEGDGFMDSDDIDCDREFNKLNGGSQQQQQIDTCSDKRDNEGDGFMDSDDIDCDREFNKQNGIMRPSAPAGAMHIKGFWQSVVKYFQGFDVTVGVAQDSLV